MKLLLDGNISDRIVPQIVDLFPHSTHVKFVALHPVDDSMVWEWARRHEFTIVTKDTDFHQRSIVFGHPPKVVWLRVGNCPTSLIVNLLRNRSNVIRTFIESLTESLLVLERNPI